MDISFFDSDAFLIGYYVLTVGASLLLIKDTKKRVLDLKAGIGSIKYAPIAGILAVYVLFAFEYVDQIPILFGVGLATTLHLDHLQSKECQNHSICAIVTLHVFTYQLF